MIRVRFFTGDFLTIDDEVTEQIWSIGAISATLIQSLTLYDWSYALLPQ